MVKKTASKSTDKKPVTGSKPTHRVFARLDREGKEPFYQKIGAGWETDKGTIWINLQFMPTDPTTSIGIRLITADEPASAPMDDDIPF